MPRKFKQAYFVSFMGEGNCSPKRQPKPCLLFSVRDYADIASPYWYCQQHDRGNYENGIGFPSGAHKRFLVPSSRIPLCQINFPYTDERSPGLNSEGLTNNSFAEKKMKNFFQNMPPFSVVYIYIHGSKEGGNFSQNFQPQYSPARTIKIPVREMAFLLDNVIPTQGKIGLKIHLLSCNSANNIRMLMWDLAWLGFTKTCVVGYPWQPNIYVDYLVQRAIEDICGLDKTGPSGMQKIHRSDDPVFKKRVCHNYLGPQQLQLGDYKTFKRNFLLPELAKQENCDGFFSLLIDNLSYGIRYCLLKWTSAYDINSGAYFLDRLAEIDYEVSIHEYAYDFLNEAVNNFISELKKLFFRKACYLDLPNDLTPLEYLWRRQACYHKLSYDSLLYRLVVNTLLTFHTNYKYRMRDPNLNQQLIYFLKYLFEGPEGEYVIIKDEKDIMKIYQKIKQYTTPEISTTIIDFL